MDIGIIGCGGVGKAFLKLLKEKEQFLKEEKLDIKVKYILEYYGGIYDKNGISLDEIINFNEKEKDITKFPKGGNKDIDFNSMLCNKDVDLIVVMTPTNKDTGEPGLSFIRGALENGIHVVTSDKGPILIDYHGLKSIAHKNSVQLAIGCTTGGALPSVNAGFIDLAGASIKSIEGVLNGTTNFILDEMEQGTMTYEEALLKAKELGIAEANPTLDVEGWDTASKLLILTNVLMNENKTLRDILVEGITSLTPEDMQYVKKQGKRFKLIGKTEIKEGKTVMTVKPEIIDNDHPLFNVCGKNKAVKYVSDTLGDLTIIGGASGVRPAAASILRDIINIKRDYKFIN